MPLINQDSLQSFFGNKHYATKNTEPEGHQEAVSQAQNIVFQNTLIEIPDNIKDAIPMLQYYGHVIYQYLTTGKQTNLSESEVNRRTSMFNKVMAELNEIRNGERSVYNNQREKIKTGFEKTPLFYASTKNRSERL